MWLQKDRATCRAAQETIQLLHKIFSGRDFSHFADQNSDRESNQTLR